MRNGALLAAYIILCCDLRADRAAAQGDAANKSGDMVSQEAPGWSNGQNRNQQLSGADVRGSQGDDEAVEVGSREWWRREKEKAYQKTGRKVWAWELDAPPGHPFYENVTSGAKSWTDGLRYRDPPSVPDILSMEPIPRPEMPEWWMPTHCGTLNLSHPLTRHCFPPDGSHHHVCCTNIPLDDEIEDETLSLSTQTLIKSIRAASHPSSYSWCACNEVVCSELLGGVVSWDQHSLTRGRYYNDQISKGFDLIGWEWLVGGLDALQELSMHALPEDDPETRPVSTWGLGHEAGTVQSGQTLPERGNHAYCAKKRCPLGPKPELLKGRRQTHRQQQQRAPALASASAGHTLSRDYGAGYGVASNGKVRSAEELARAREALWGKDD